MAYITNSGLHHYLINLKFEELWLCCLQKSCVRNKLKNINILLLLPSVFPAMVQGGAALLVAIPHFFLLRASKENSIIFENINIIWTEIIYSSTVCKRLSVNINQFTNTLLTLSLSLCINIISATCNWIVSYIQIASFNFISSVKGTNIFCAKTLFYLIRS